MEAGSFAQGKGREMPSAGAPFGERRVPRASQAPLEQDVVAGLARRCVFGRQHQGNIREMRTLG